VRRTRTADAIEGGSEVPDLNIIFVQAVTSGHGQCDHARYVQCIGICPLSPLDGPRPSG
jgi:hypothetical protein